MSSEQRLDRLERVLLLVVRAGARERKAIRKGMAEAREGLKETDEKINALIDAQMRTEDEMAHLARAQAETEETLRAFIANTDEKLNAFIANTDEKLNAFIGGVERLVNERRKENP